MFLFAERSCEARRLAVVSLLRVNICARAGPGKVCDKYVFVPRGLFSTPTTFPATRSCVIMPSELCRMRYGVGNRQVGFSVISHLNHVKPLIAHFYSCSCSCSVMFPRVLPRDSKLPSIRNATLPDSVKGNQGRRARFAVILIYSLITEMVSLYYHERDDGGRWRMGPTRVGRLQSNDKNQQSSVVRLAARRITSRYLSRTVSCLPSHAVSDGNRRTRDETTVTLSVICASNFVRSTESRSSWCRDVVGGRAEPSLLNEGGPLDAAVEGKCNFHRDHPNGALFILISQRNFRRP